MQHDVQELCRVVSFLYTFKKVLYAQWTTADSIYFFCVYACVRTAAPGQRREQNERHLCWGNNPKALQRKDGGMSSLFLRLFLLLADSPF